MALKSFAKEDMDAAIQLLMSEAGKEVSDFVFTDGAGDLNLNPMDEESKLDFYEEWGDEL